MTVSSANNRNSYTGNGSNDTFAYSFKIFDDDEIAVYKVITATGVATLQTKTTDYTVTGVGASAGGNVVFETAAIPASTETVVLLRAQPLLQETDYAENDAFPADTHETALDKLTMQVQMLEEELDRAITLHVGESVANLTIPDLGVNADKFLKINSAGTGLTAAEATSGTATLLDEDDMSSDSSSDGATQQSIKAYVDSGTVTMTNKTLTSPVINTGVSGTAFLDEDDMSTNSATHLASQQSIKAYVDAGTVTFTNKTIDANGTGNSISNIDVADLADGTDGELITWDASGSPATVAAGTANQVLTSNGAGAAPTFQDAAGGGLEDFTVVGPTAVTSTNGVSILSSVTGLQEIIILATAVSSNANSNAFSIRVGDACGLKTSGYISNHLDETGGTQLTTHFKCGPIDLAAAASNVMIHLVRIQGTNIWTMKAGGASFGPSAAMATGWIDVGAELTDIQANWDGGASFDGAGSVTVYHR